MHIELKELLDKVIQGEPEIETEPKNYHNFLNKRRQLKGGCSDLEFAIYLSQQVDFSKLEAQVYFDLGAILLTSENRILLNPGFAKHLEALIEQDDIHVVKKLSAAYLLSSLYIDATQKERIFLKSFDLARQAPKDLKLIANYCVSAMYCFVYGVNNVTREEMKWISAAAKQGAVSAQGILGAIYGLGCPAVNQDNQEAVKWFRLGALQGNAFSQYYLGRLCTAEEHGEAVKWLRHAAEQGNPGAQYHLACKYERGIGVKQDTVEAAKWFLCAAEQGHPEAQCDLAAKHEYGIGFREIDMAEALKWYQRAAANGNQQAKEWIDIQKCRQTRILPSIVVPRAIGYKFAPVYIVGNAAQSVAEITGTKRHANQIAEEPESKKSRFNCIH